MSVPRHLHPVPICAAFTFPVPPLIIRIIVAEANSLCARCINGDYEAFQRLNAVFVEGEQDAAFGKINRFRHRQLN